MNTRRRARCKGVRLIFLFKSGDIVYNALHTVCPAKLVSLRLNFRGVPLDNPLERILEAGRIRFPNLEDIDLIGPGLAPLLKLAGK